MTSQEELGKAFSDAVQKEHWATVDLRAAIERAIDTKIARILAQIHMEENRGATPKQLKRLYDEIRFLGNNRHFSSPFVHAPLDSSWRKRTLGF